MGCPFCDSSSFIPHWYPPTQFNNKKIEYVRCTACNLAYQKNKFTNEDLKALYPVTYQSGVDSTLLKDLTKPKTGLRFAYQIQFDVIKMNHTSIKILDYGCGDGNFLANAKAYGFEVIGVEFNPDQVDLLSKALPEIKFFSVPEFLNSNELYPIIRLSNVLEHMVDPKKELQEVINKLEPGGILFLEGPIEMNFNLAFLFRKIYFKLRKTFQPNKMAHHQPYHIFFSDRKNQKEFFKNFKLKQTEFLITERPWPFPEDLSSPLSIGKLFKFCVARVSMFCSAFHDLFFDAIGNRRFSYWGNTFLYVGKKDQQ